jgi:hypothetical protein
MKPEMSKMEFANLELRLRQLRLAEVPIAPPGLHQVIPTVPATTAQRHRLSLRLTGSSPLRRGTLLVGVAAALVIAVVASSFVVNFRAAQTAGPAASADWRWQKADGTILGLVSSVARGYVAVCKPAGPAAATPTDALDQLQQQLGGPDAGSLCTSPDGTTWTTPPDPHILDVPAGSTFSPGMQAQFGDVRLIASMRSDGAGNSVTDLWRSTDGVSWKRVADPRLQNLTVMSLGVLNGRFMGAAMDVSTATGWVVASADGLTWQRTSQLPAEPNSSVVAAGLMTLSSDGVVRMSRDGSSWRELQLPGGIWYVGTITQLSDGEYVASGMGSDGPAQHILRSNDGISWRIDEGDVPGSIIGLTWLGGRFVATILEGVAPDEIPSANLADLRLWQSFDSGHTWSRLIGPEGEQMAGLAIPMGDAIGVVVPDAQNAWHLAWIGRLGPSSNPAPSSKPSPVALSTTQGYWITTADDAVWNLN